jgi:mannose-6-phosphate isomerase-like protein (cupin superfamily)
LTRARRPDRPRRAAAAGPARARRPRPGLVRRLSLTALPTCRPALPRDAAADALDPSLHEDLSHAQVWLLSWRPGQGTGLHDHGGSAGAFAVVRGTLHERVGAREGAAELSAGRVRHFGQHHLQQVSSTGTQAAVSVHVHTPRLTVMNTYRVDGRGLVHTGTEEAGVDR